MRHLELRDLWLQQQVRERLVEVSKVPGERNPADLMTKILSLADIRIRVADLGMEMVEENVVGGLVGVRRVRFIGVVEIGSQDFHAEDMPGPHASSSAASSSDQLVNPNEEIVEAEAEWPSCLQCVLKYSNQVG